MICDNLFIVHPSNKAVLCIAHSRLSICVQPHSFRMDGQKKFTFGTQALHGKFN